MESLPLQCGSASILRKPSHSHCFEPREGAFCDQSEKRESAARSSLRVGSRRTGGVRDSPAVLGGRLVGLIPPRPFDVLFDFGTYGLCLPLLFSSAWTPGRPRRTFLPNGPDGTNASSAEDPGPTRIGLVERRRSTCWRTSWRRFSESNRMSITCSSVQGWPGPGVRRNRARFLRP